MNPFEIGKANAETAIDQQASHTSLRDALQSYNENVYDTLIETRQFSDADVLEAQRGFDAVLKQHNIDPKLYY